MTNIRYGCEDDDDNDYFSLEVWKIQVLWILLKRFWFDKLFEIL